MESTEALQPRSATALRSSDAPTKMERKEIASFIRQWTKAESDEMEPCSAAVKQVVEGWNYLLRKADQKEVDKFQKLLEAENEPDLSAIIRVLVQEGGQCRGTVGSLLVVARGISKSTRASAQRKQQVISIVVRELEKLHDWIETQGGWCVMTQELQPVHGWEMSAFLGFLWVMQKLAYASKRWPFLSCFVLGGLISWWWRGRA